MSLDSLNPAQTAGLYGKLPSRGDFLTRSLPRTFVEPWDRWLQQGMSASRNLLGEAWLDRYLVGPIWQFALSPGLAGPEGWLGMWLPSVDRVGRYFPLTIARPLTSPCAALTALSISNDWLSQAESLALAALNDEIPAEEIDPALANLSAGCQAVPALPSLIGPGSWRLSLAANASLEPVLGAMAERILGERLGPYSVWRTNGSDGIEPALLLTAGLPEPNRFTALLDGRWQIWGWETP